VRPKVIWADLICRTHQHYQCQWLPNTEWSNSRRWAWARDWRLWRERLWEKESFKTTAKDAMMMMMIALMIIMMTYRN